MSEASNEKVMPEATPQVIAGLQKDLQEHKNALNVSNNQVLSHQEVITALMQENLNLRTNFKLSQQYYNDALKGNQTLNAINEDLSKKLDAANKELEALKQTLASSQCAAEPEFADVA